ncbi:SNF2 domain-containing protein CLASSY 3-like isoform X1 [Arachis ipaensis]|uniref:SNF2 domain-containing protein CLASSY 3-like isoform X1 n=1 Tax=Arachis ipaensis TaxID=130454 RepID=UPI000A2B795C|nr:SNF2 domain-containing protein CLASSY 3-like isoform X1 [Arachis ipaensis]
MHSNTVPVASRTRSRTPATTTMSLSSSDDDEVVVKGETPPKPQPERGSTEEEEEGSGNRDSENVKEGENREDITRKRRKFGVDILIDQSLSPDGKSVAHRTRSHFPKSKKNLLFGTFSQPICLADDDEEQEQEQEQEKEEGQQPGKQGEDDEEEHVEEEEEDEEEEEGEEDEDDDDESLYESEETDLEEEDDDDDDDYSVERDACMNNVANFEGKKQKRKRVDVASMLRDMMFGKGEVPLLESVEEESGATVVTMDVPTRSPFNSEKHAPPEKSTDQEEVLDAIWAEMERGFSSDPVEEGHGSNEFKCRGSKREKGSAFEFTRKIEDQDLGGEFQDCVAQEKGKLSSKSSIEEGNSCVDFPFKFTFLTKELPAEKSQDEKEIDRIWSEMELGLHVIQQDSASAPQQGENNADRDQFPVEGDANTPPFFRCRKGEHNLVLDEEIGLICKYCLHVAQEIKNWVPPFVESPWEKSDRRDYYYYGDDVDRSVFDELHDRTSLSDDYNLGNHKGTVWDMIPGVKKTMYPHQCEAFEFLWSHLAGGIFLDQLKGENTGNGCVVSHAPGTGKTRLAIVFIQSYMKLYPACSPMIIAPKSMLLTWEEEFKIWKVDIPFHNVNNSEYSGNENETALNLINKFGRNASTQAAKRNCRTAKFYSWKLGKSILGISYKLFELLTREGSRDKVMRKFLLEQPSLLVLDEGHTPRNKTSAVWKSVSEIETKRRIILSGTPFQNNFRELYTTLCLARPKFADLNPRDEHRGRWRYLVSSYGKVTDTSRKLKILKEIREMIQPFVHVYKGTILQDSLPGLRQLVVILKPTQLQEKLLQDLKKRFDNVLKLEYEESVAAFHPSLCELAEDKEKIQKCRLNPNESAKTKFLMELIRISGIFNEKVLVFSQFIEPLKLLLSQLKQHFSWTEGREVLQMHGKQEAKLRQASIHTFNDPNSKVKVMLASTKACYEGISLVGASRVVLLDVVWNPSVEKQAISRAYRLGQKKLVFTYHLITKGTTDEKKCGRQAVKDQLSELVFFHTEGGAQNRQLFSSALEDEILEQIIEQEKFRHIIEKVAIKKPNLL